MIRLTFAFIMGLALGVLIRDTRQDWLDHEKEQKLTKQVRSCPYYWVTKSDGTQSCRALMIRGDWMYPVKPARQGPK